MGRKELSETTGAHVAFPKASAVYRVDLGVRVDVPDALDVTDQELVLGGFKGKMRERVGGVALVFVIDEAPVVVVLLVGPVDVLLHGAQGCHRAVDERDYKCFDEADLLGGVISIVHFGVLPGRALRSDIVQVALGVFERIDGYLSYIPAEGLCPPIPLREAAQHMMGKPQVPSSKWSRVDLDFDDFWVFLKGPRLQVEPEHLGPLRRDL
mmetsp:Transcript_20384/g.38374  ORF Transcript_20384/g.38374 Transcript_20384/m.38374 type:complete len:210 (-) Transcript_20384:442-1071(-)